MRFVIWTNNMDCYFCDMTFLARFKREKNITIFVVLSSAYVNLNMSYFFDIND